MHGGAHSTRGCWEWFWALQSPHPGGSSRSFIWSTLEFLLGRCLPFVFYLHGLLRFVRERTSAGLRELALVALSYPIFLWIALEVVTVYDVSPDLAAVAILCLTAGLLIRLKSSDPLKKFALFGFILGVGYWIRTILFPLGFVILLSAYLWQRSSPRWMRAVAFSALVFVVTASPLVFLLSRQKGRFTFGDSGRVNYAWAVSPRTFSRNWQGKEAGSGKPAHPTRQLLMHPPLFEFDGPVDGTYPLLPAIVLERGASVAFQA